MLRHVNTMLWFLLLVPFEAMAVADEDLSLNEELSILGAAITAGSIEVVAMLLVPCQFDGSALDMRDMDGLSPLHRNALHRQRCQL